MPVLKCCMTIFILAVVIYVACSDDKSTSPPDQLHGLKYTGQYNTPNRAVGVIIADNYAYVADQDSGMQIINVADPAQPVLSGHYQCPGASQVDLVGTKAFIADETLYSLEIVDVSDPSNPNRIGRFDTLEVLGIRVAGNYAYMGCGTDGFQVVDITDPTDPFLAGSCKEVELLRFELAGNYALVPGENGYEGLFTVNLSDPSNPGVAGSVPTGGTPYEVAIKGNYAYMTNLGNLFTLTDTSYLHIIDISNMTAPQKVDSILLGNKTIADFIANNYLYVTFINSDTTTGFHVIDISDPVNPEIIATQIINVMPWDIWVENSYIYIAADTAGLIIYRFYP